MDESEQVNIADGADLEQQKYIPHPWPYLGEIFEVVGSKNYYWRLRCVLCQPQNILIVL